MDEKRVILTGRQSGKTAQMLQAAYDENYLLRQKLAKSEARVAELEHNVEALRSDARAALNRAQGDRGAEPVAWGVWANGGIVTAGCSEAAEREWAENYENARVVPLYTQPQPQPAVPEVPTEQMLDEGVTSLTRGLKAFGSNYTQIVNNIWEDMAATLLSTPTTPQADGWVRCEDRLPAVGQRVILKSRGVVQHYMPTLDQGDNGFGGGELFWDFGDTDADCPPVDFENDEWMPAPVGQEGA